MKVLLSLMLLCSAAAASDGPVVFIEAEQRYAKSNVIWEAQPSKIVSVPEITDRLMKYCPSCVVTIKKENAEYIINFAPSQGWTKKNWSWTVYENEQGTVLGKGNTGLFNNSIKDAVEVILNRRSMASK